MSDASPEAAPHLVFLCTGNAARSVMAGAIVADRAPGVRVTTAGTLVVEGMPMSLRTRRALEDIGVRADGHRSRQVGEDDVDAADLVVALAREHVEYIRRTHPRAAAHTATLKRLVRDLPGTTGSLVDRVAALGLAEVELEEWEDVDDPAGGHPGVFIACAHELVELIESLLATLGFGP